MLKNKIILITGSSTGIGAGIAIEAVKQGAKVMIHGRERERAEKIQAQLGKENAAVSICSLNNAESCQQLIADTIATFGRIDGLVNNAGIYPRSNIDTANEAAFDEVINTNLKMPLFLAQAAINAFRKTGGGSIVNIGSINAYCGQNDLLIYSISKGGLMTLTRNLAESLGTENIRCNQLNVGWTVTETELAVQEKNGLASGWQHRVSKTYAPSGSLLTPEKVAPHVVFWLSDYSAPTNGQIYEVEQYPMLGRNHINHFPLS